MLTRISLAALAARKRGQAIAMLVHDFLITAEEIVRGRALC